MTTAFPKRLVCRFHGGHLDGEFDSSRDLGHGWFDRFGMLFMFSRLTIGETVGGASEAAITAILQQGTLPQSRSDGKADLYAVMNRSDSDSGVEIDMVYGVLERRDGTSFLVGNDKGNPFEWKMED